MDNASKDLLTLYNKIIEENESMDIPEISKLTDLIMKSMYRIEI